MEELKPGSEDRSSEPPGHDTVERLTQQLARRDAELQALRRQLQQSQPAEIARLEAQLSRCAAQLAELNRETAVLASAISHDLRSPLNTINGFCYLLNKNYRSRLDGRGQEFLDLIVSGTKRMAHLIDDIVGLMRIGLKAPVAVALNLSAIAEEIFRNLRLTEPGRQAEVVIAAGVTATGDERLVRVVMEHLLNNAWKFTRHQPHARIEFGRQSQGQERVFFVRDNGVGFNLENAEGLFTPFKRLHTQKEYEGAGVGLAVAARIVRLHDGRIWVRAAENDGATFYFTLGTEPHAAGSAPD
jgi:light-regulated signal transduction histidine kinase (bacteriophytochrome)